MFGTAVQMLFVVGLGFMVFKALGEVYLSLKGKNVAQVNNVDCDDESFDFSSKSTTLDYTIEDSSSIHFLN